MLPLDILLQKRLLLNAQKSVLCSQKELNVKRLRVIIKKQAYLNGNILFTSERIAKKDMIAHDIRKTITQHNLLLNRQLSHIDVKNEVQLKSDLEQERRLNLELTKYFHSKNKELYALLNATKRKEIIQLKRLIDSIRKNAFELKNSLGNRAKVTRYGNLLLKNIEKMEETDVYSFMKDDLEKIKQRVRKVIQNPKEAKFTDIIGSFYFFLPGSFEMTSLYLLLRYGRHYLKKRRNKL